MIHNDDLLERMKRANPVPDSSRLNSDSDESRRFSHLVEQRRQQMDDTKVRPIKTREKPPRSKRGILVAAAAFAIVVGTGIGIALFSGGGEGSDVAGVPVPAEVETLPTEVTAQAIPVDRRDFMVVEVQPDPFTVDAVRSADSLIVFLKVPGAIDDGDCVQLSVTNVGSSVDYSGASVGDCDSNILGGEAGIGTLTAGNAVVFKVPLPPTDLIDVLVEHRIFESPGEIDYILSTFGGPQEPVSFGNFPQVKPGDTVKTDTLGEVFSEDLGFEF